MMDEKDVIGLMAGAIESTEETVKNSVCADGNVGVDRETLGSMMTEIINEKLRNIDKRVYHLEYTDHCNMSNSAVSIMELRKDLNSLMYKVDQMEAALNMSKKYRKRRAKVSKN